MYIFFKWPKFRLTSFYNNCVTIMLLKIRSKKRWTVRRIQRSMDQLCQIRMLDDETPEEIAIVTGWFAFVLLLVSRSPKRGRRAKSCSRVQAGRIYVQRKHTYAGVYIRTRPERETRDIPFLSPALPLVNSFCSKSPIDSSRLSIGDSPGVNSCRRTGK